ncbi:hypothetical protein GCM10023340_30250 [Nocardioides marinquilinus]|uniref:Peptidase MA-like domain-containing protein n=1 Tax=Nocardioides marinquilinus TaxID=1210400 RepID=A0ABP9PVH0_9ACTN
MLVALGTVTWLVVVPDEPTDPDDEPYAAAVPTDGTARVDAGAAALALQRLARAVEDGDRAAAEALADPADADAATRLGEVVDTAVAARVVDVTMRYVDEEGAPADDGTWAAAVDVGWRYAGFDRASATTEVQVRFAPSGRAGTPALVAGLGGGSLRTPVWLSGPTDVVRTRDLLVVVADPGAATETYRRLAARAVPEVASVVTTWRPRLVVEVPADGAALERALDAEEGSYGQIAAVAGTADGSVAAGSPVHVFVNPDVFDTLGPVGRQVVLTHEATHVATDAPLSQAPTWLVEGFADYVALRDVDLSLRETAGQVAGQVRADGLPTALPGTAEFDTRGPHLGAVYEAAWLVCVTLAERRDGEALERLYTRVSDGADLEQALADGFGWSVADLVRAWRARLAGLPGAAA